ncbi:prostate stem cell antigen-like [Denticeps clupeoides]|uniref:UPAR/Ly6 domain-containing protein n=1 Tax=Denticeps clupeoides TaxID=299321 RepID=A0A8C3ZT87_9TELE|nr:prostate stem cell antigen-like [Denticeps clupeoides]XP_028837574.1 prostate stem cell antigen-like [Denticeps clupeoides]
MRTRTALLLLLGLSIQTAEGLKCYVCSASTTNAGCTQNTQDCSPPLDTCMTTVDTMGKVSAIVKQCASRATCSGAASSAKVDSAGNGNRVSCCSSYLCNYNTASGVQPHRRLLGAVLCCVTVLLSV